MPSTELSTANSSPTITIRPIRLADADMEADFVRQLSPMIGKTTGSGRSF